VLRRVGEQGRRVGLALLTHGHDDHAGSAELFAELTGAPVRGAGRGEPLSDGEVVSVGGLELQVLLTPGHTRDSVSFLLGTERILFTGDMVLGRGTTVVAHPDGELTAYLDSMTRMHQLAADGAVRTVAPGHGPVVTDAEGWTRYYLDHRRERLQQVHDAVARIRAGSEASDHDPAELADLVVQDVYADVPRQVWPAARQSVRAQLEYLGLV
jgi:glyoxylase-like metal-dependent hydrolase (beta-lactamase superfamily II)